VRQGEAAASEGAPEFDQNGPFDLLLNLDFTNLPIALLAMTPTPEVDSIKP